MKTIEQRITDLKTELETIKKDAAYRLESWQGEQHENGDHETGQMYYEQYDKLNSAAQKLDMAIYYLEQVLPVN